MNKINHKPLKIREVHQASYAGLVETGTTPAMARLFAARGIGPDILSPSIGILPAKDSLEGCLEAGRLLADAVIAGKHICCINDFDVDGCLSGTLVVRALRTLGAKCDYIVPSRKLHGYGISIPLVHIAKDRGVEVIVTVDNGTVGFAGILEARRLNICTIITDHHMPSDDGKLPVADCIVNPCLIGNKFPVKSLAGVGVAFYVIAALREELKARNYPKTFNLSQMLELVAIATVGDMVPLFSENRALVNMGIEQIRSGKSCVGVRALLNIIGKNPLAVNAETLSFQTCPRINSAGRLHTADIGVELMLTDDMGTALGYAKQLDDINNERKSIQLEMTERAQEIVDGIDVEGRCSLVVFDEFFEEGVVGLVSSKLKEKYDLPSAAFAIGQNGKLKGSFRSIDGVHVRDAVILVQQRCPELNLVGGGHSHACGFGGFEVHQLDKFTREFDKAVREIALDGAFSPFMECDGALQAHEITFDFIEKIKAENWGQRFPTPLFEGRFKVLSQRILKDAHTKLELQLGMQTFQAILFNHNEPLPEHIHALYKLDINEYRGVSSIQLMIEAINA